MYTYLQIIVSLFIIIIVQMSLHIYVIRKFKSTSNEKDGPNIGQKFPFVSYENYNGELKNIDNNFFNNGNSFIFLSLNCSVCKLLLESLDLYKDEYLEKVRLVLLKSEYHLRDMRKYEEKIMILEEETIKNVFNIRSFPFIIKVNDEGEVQRKGYLTRNNLIDFIT